MKIAIVTFNGTENFGTAFQEFGLQKTLLKLGNEVVTVHYNNEYGCKRYSIQNLRNKGIKGYCISMIGVAVSLLRMPNFKRYRRKYLKETEMYNKDSIKKISRQYDLYVAGSDQIWNPLATNFDTTYLLNFLEDDEKRVSYAGSFGVSELEEKYRYIYTQLLGKFLKLSVREKQGLEILDGLGIKDAQVVLDPTLLLTREEWEKLASPKRVAGDYIFLYQIGLSNSLVHFAEKLAKEKGCKIIAVPMPLGKSFKCHWKLMAGPEEWLGLLAHAKYVVTDSFHGTAFSINFNKEFFIEVCASGVCLGSKTGSRFENILDMFDLKDRMIVDGECEAKDKVINYSVVNEKLKTEREKSIQYIQNCMKL